MSRLRSPRPDQPRALRHCFEAGDGPAHSSPSISGPGRHQVQTGRRFISLPPGPQSFDASAASPPHRANATAEVLPSLLPEGAPGENPLQRDGSHGPASPSHAPLPSGEKNRHPAEFRLGNGFAKRPRAISDALSAETTRRRRKKASPSRFFRATLGPRTEREEASLRHPLQRD
jgi:hypothetical protein